LPRIYQPNEWNEESVHKEHDALLLDDTIGVSIEVMEWYGLYSQSHQSCREEQSQSVFEGEW